MYNCQDVNDTLMFFHWYTLCTQNEEQLRTFFKKIDNHSNGYIGWVSCKYVSKVNVSDTNLPHAG